MLNLSVGSRYLYASVKEIKVNGGETVIVWEFDDGEIVETGLDAIAPKKQQKELS